MVLALIWPFPEFPLLGDIAQIGILKSMYSIVLASRGCGCHLDTQILKNHPSGQSDFFQTHHNSHDIVKYIMPYFKIISQDFINDHFGHPVSKTWLRPGLQA